MTNGTEGRGGRYCKIGAYRAIRGLAIAKRVIRAGQVAKYGGFGGNAGSARPAYSTAVVVRKISGKLEKMRVWGGKQRFWGGFYAFWSVLTVFRNGTPQT